jgi:hypothetical protein
VKSLQSLRSALAIFVCYVMGSTGWTQQPPGPTALPQGLRQPTATSGPARLISGAVPVNTTAVNFGLTAAATSPISVTLGWVGVPGATGYTVLRDGVGLASLSNAARSYVDNTVKPQVQYSYQLRAGGLTLSINGRPSPYPLDSAAVQVPVPLPAPPPGFTAMLQGTQVRLSWAGRPEATAYEVQKGSQITRVAATNGPLTLVDQSPGKLDAQYTIRSIVRAFDGTESAGLWSPQLSIRVRPFNVAFIGDSIMWGQGLADADKFSTRFRLFLAGALGGRTVYPANYSHSGAIIGTDPDDRDRPANATMRGGEVPESYPTVLNQALGLVRTDFAQHQFNPTDVDLIVMDGCANDVTLGKVLAPWTNDSEIEAAAQSYCNLQMTYNLQAIHAVYTNAKILVTGYYPIVSAQSNLAAVAVLGSTVLGPVGTVAAVVSWDKAIAHSTTFFASANTMIQMAVVSTDARIGANVIKFVVPSFDASNSYAAPNSWLWLVPVPPTLPNQFDEVFASRQLTCLSMGTSMPATCPPASMGHPNALGALAYANALIAAASEFVPQWQRQFALVQHL